MALKLFHQVGHNASWNIDSFEKEQCGDGLILSPVHQSPGSIEKMREATLRASIFDPQFYLPSSQKPKLLQYDFFPEVITEGFSTSSFEASVKDAAKRCLEFQRNMKFRRLVVPTRFLDQMYSNYVDRQRAFTVDAFMEQIGSEEEVCINLAVTSSMLEDEGFRTKLLSWITSYSNVSELYMIYSAPRERKQIHNKDLLVACHRLGQEMRGIGLELTWGHQNTEALLATAQGDVALSMGSFENTRIFSTDKFVASDDERRGPKARIYLPGLLNWLQFDQAKEIRGRFPKLWKSIYWETRHAEEALGLVLEPTFNQPQLYKHYFLCMSKEVGELKSSSIQDRIAYLKQRVAAAQSAYAEIGRTIQLEKHGQGTHLDYWRAALEVF